VDCAAACGSRRRRPRADNIEAGRFPRLPAWAGDLILLEITFIAGRGREARLALLRALDEHVVAAVGISPDDLAIMVYETAGENISFGRGKARRAHIAAAA
jgi:hypothetical protein